MSQLSAEAEPCTERPSAGWRAGSGWIGTGLLPGALVLAVRVIHVGGFQFLSHFL